MDSDSTFENRRTKNMKVFNLNKVHRGGRTVCKRNISYVIGVLTFFHLATYSLQGLFCNALPPISQNITVDILHDSDISSNKRIIQEEWETEDINEKKNSDEDEVSSSSSYMDHKGLFCGARMSDLVTLNVTARNALQQSIATMWGAETFPWMVAVGLLEGDNGLPSLLCSGAAVSKFVVLVPAHCITGAQKSRVVILSNHYSPSSEDVSRSFRVENIIVHPDYIPDHPSNQHDLAVIKIREDENDKEGSSSNGFQIFACLPDEGDDPIGNCQVATYIHSDKENKKTSQADNNNKESNQIDENLQILAHDIEFGPSMACSDETADMRGYLDDHQNILCTLGREQCNRLIRGPVFCQNHDQVDRFSLVGLSTNAENWCSVGAYTRLARYSKWVYKSIEYFEGRPLLKPRQQLNTAVDDDEEDNKNNPCASSPCGLNSKCWDSGRSFICTCNQYDFPWGNPYKGCFECTFDRHCNQKNSNKTAFASSKEENYKCINNVCEMENPVSSLGQKTKIPSEYVKAGTRSTDYYYVSEDSLTWPQASNECQSKNGRLAELDGRSRFDRALVNLLKLSRSEEESKNRTRIRFWVGATDLGERGNFVWYSADNKKVSDNNWAFNGRPDKDTQVQYDDYEVDKDQRCLQIDTDGKWNAFSCEFESRFICQFHPASNSEIGGNALGINTSGQRSERQRNFETLSPKANYKDVCGRRFIRQRGQRIVGGGIAQYGEWPWQVSLRQYKNGQFRHKCGAALLTHQWIVTAAHCVKDVAPSNLLVRVGEYNVLDGNEAHPHIDRRITRLVTHSSFDRASYEYDIALLKMVAPVSFQPNIIPICLPQSDSDLVGKTGSVTGWGRRSEYGQISPVLREVHLPIISNNKCMQMYRLSGQNEWLPRIFLCAGTSNGGKDSCEGDSGGPLVLKGRNGRFQLAGIISWGIGCGDRNRPGVYTRISEFRKWIQRNANYKS